MTYRTTIIKNLWPSEFISLGSRANTEARTGHLGPKGPVDRTHGHSHKRHAISHSADISRAGVTKGS